MQSAQMTEIDWDVLLRDEMGWAIEQRRRLKGDEDFRMRVRIVGPNGEMANTPIQWQNAQEKSRWMRALSTTCKMTFAQAAIITSDARLLNTPGFCKRFNLVEPGPSGWEAFEIERRRIMKGYDFYMGNLPRDCFNDTLMVAIYGPKVCKIGATMYSEVNGEIVFDPMDAKVEGKTKVFMLPAWWQ
jgi:hypothetical protein